MDETKGNGQHNEEGTSPPDGLTPWRGISHPKKLGLLKAYPLLGTISSACKAVMIDRRSHTRWMKEDPEYAAAFRDVQADFVDRLEHEAFRRAVLGIDKPMTIAGSREIVKEYDTTLLIFLLKGAAPQKYRERLGVAVETSAAPDYNDYLNRSGQNGHVNRIEERLVEEEGNGKEEQGGG